MDQGRPRRRCVPRSSSWGLCLGRLALGPHKRQTYGGGGVVITARDYSPSTAGLLRRYRLSVNFPTVIFRPPLAFVLFWSTFLFLSSQPTLDLSSTHFYSFCAHPPPPGSSTSSTTHHAQHTQPSFHSAQTTRASRRASGPALCRAITAGQPLASVRDTLSPRPQLLPLRRRLPRLVLAR